MKIFFNITITVTLITFLYAHQNIEITKLGYRLNSNHNSLAMAFDEQNKLTYNLNKLEAPELLWRRIYTEKIDLLQADSGSIIYASLPVNDDRLTESLKTESLFAKVFDAFALRAEAKEKK